MKSPVTVVAQLYDRLCGVMRALRGELARLNRVGVEDVRHAGRRERARMVAAELTRRYRTPNRCC